MKEAASITLRPGSGQVRGVCAAMRTRVGTEAAGRRERGWGAGLPDKGYQELGSFSLTTLFFRLNFRFPQIPPLK